MLLLMYFGAHSFGYSAGKALDVVVDFVEVHGHTYTLAAMGIQAGLNAAFAVGLTLLCTISFAAFLRHYRQGSKHIIVPSDLSRGGEGPSTEAFVEALLAAPNLFDVGQVCAEGGDVASTTTSSTKRYSTTFSPTNPGWYAPLDSEQYVLKRAVRVSTVVEPLTLCASVPCSGGTPQAIAPVVAACSCHRWRRFVLKISRSLLVCRLFQGEGVSR